MEPLFLTDTVEYEVEEKGCIFMQSSQKGMLKEKTHHSSKTRDIWGAGFDGSQDLCFLYI